MKNCSHCWPHRTTPLPLPLSLSHSATGSAIAEPGPRIRLNRKNQRYGSLFFTAERFVQATHFVLFFRFFFVCSLFSHNWPVAVVYWSYLSSRLLATRWPPVAAAAGQKIKEGGKRVKIVECFYSTPTHELTLPSHPSPFNSHLEKGDFFGRVC